MILVDFTPTIISSAISQFSQTRELLNGDLLRHFVLSQLRTYSKKFKSSYGEMIICYDSSPSWRVSVFPFYKKRRTYQSKDGGFNWQDFYVHLNMIKEEFRHVLPYRVIEAANAEADDVIGVLAKIDDTNSNACLIISRDRDFFQLHSEYVKQYDPIDERILYEKQPEQYLLEHIIEGDGGDDVPNVLSDDDTFMIKTKRQTTLSKQRKAILLEYFGMNSTLSFQNETPSSLITDKVKENFTRNETMISLDKIPPEIKNNILSAYEQTKPNPTMKLFNYCIKHNLRVTTEHLNDF